MSTHIITGNSPHGIVRFPRALTAPWGVFALGALFAIVGIACLALIRGPHDLPLLLLYLYTASRFGFGMRIAQLSAIPADVFRGPFAASMHAHTTASARRPAARHPSSLLRASRTSARSASVRSRSATLRRTRSRTCGRGARPDRL